jgi:hypothetical protein
MVRRVVEWDEEETGYVGRLMEGHFEHVALTRPRHAAYPDAKLEQVFLSGETFAEAWKSLIAATQQEIEDVEASAAAEEAAVQAEKSVHGDEAIATATRIVKADRDPTSIQTLIFDGDRFSVEEAKAWAKKNGFEAGKVDQTEGGSIRLRQREPGEFKPDSFRTIALTDGVKAVVGRPKGNEAEKTANSREGEIEMEVKVRKTDPAKVTVEKEADAAKKESESEAKKESESESKKEDAKKESESEDTKEDAKKEDAKKESEDEDAGMVVKGIERSLRRIGRSLAGFEKRQKAVEDQLGILAKQPATSGAVRFNDGSVVNGGKGEEKGGALDGAVEILKGITDPKEKDLLSRQLAAKILSGVFEGGASGKTS